MSQAEWYTREETETSQQYGEVPENRDLDEQMEKGIFIIDKPFGPTSKQVSTWVKKELNLKKTGHFGTLDPNASGILPVGLNRGTRINKALAQAQKEYIFEVEFREQVEQEELKKALKEFKGVNKQVPPKKSAVKREQRERKVYEIELLETNEEKALARVKCESGFYVRVLVDELGEKLDTDADMEELRRTQQGDLTEKDINTLQDIVDAYHFYKQEGEEEKLREVLYPIEKAINHLPKIAIKDSAVNAVANGSNLGAVGISKFQDGIKKEDTVAITTLKGELVALATAKMNSEQLYEEKGEAAVLQNVYMDPDTYPKRWKQDNE